MKNAINKLRMPHVQWYVTAAVFGAITVIQLLPAVLILRSAIR